MQWSRGDLEPVPDAVMLHEREATLLRKVAELLSGGLAALAQPRALDAADRAGAAVQRALERFREDVQRTMRALEGSVRRSAWRGARCASRRSRRRSTAPASGRRRSRGLA